MASAGYSGTPLLRKLGITPALRLLIIHEPDNYESLLNTSITAQRVKKNEVPDLIHLFVKNENEFTAVMKKITPFIQDKKSIVIWVSWYKKASGIKTDITEDSIRNYALKNGLVDVKVCAVSDLWSALKLVVPQAKR